MSQGPIEDLSPHQLRQFIQDNHESAYRLIDVRQPGEYEQDHIPGARLVPLPNLSQSLDDLAGDKDLVFYCRSGGRSLAAAAMVEEEQVSQGRIFNLRGGIMAWDGVVVQDIPQVQLLRGQTGRAMLKTAMNLEKGALRFYEQVQVRFAGQDWAALFGRLSKAESAHARIVYGFLKKVEASVESFQAMFAGLSGEVLEGGLPLAATLERVAAMEQDVCVRLTELALKIEYAAFDLYRTVADQAAEAEAQKAFMELAQAEKAHMRALSEGIGNCPA